MAIGAPRYVAVGRICHIARNGDILAVKLRIGMISSIYFKISGSPDLEMLHLICHKSFGVEGQSVFKHP